MSMRYSRVEAVPEDRLEEVEVAQDSVPPMITTAAIATPICEPMPPSTTMARMIADSRKLKLSGETKPWRAAKKEPAKPPNMAPDREGGELGVGGVDAERAAGDLVLAQRFPGAADRQPAQPQGDEVGDEGEARIR